MPGVAIVMLFCISMGQAALGLLLASVVVFGMAFTIGVVGLLVITARNTVLRRMERGAQGLERVEHFMRLAGGSALCSVGTLFLLSPALR